eukprot:CAMPEP_0117733836 /NCGR_PEP_ID=MMETSP0947-20121206/303_1 /TAXON_ID=44440 /ORGANISM="Chattonella subsalsa, Strain CCMP2191" /LENGTH=341 /DNA_ID=CAMNT_0005548475 /DNA_START=1 /DNA_END=1026 /DNA_ORIENTATION=-
MKPPYDIFILNFVMDHEVFDQILKYTYGLNGLKTKFSSKLLWPLREAAKRFQINDLIKDLNDVLLSKLNERNFCHYFWQFGKINDPCSMMICIEKLKSKNSWNHEMILSSEHFLKLRIYPELRLLLMSRALNVENIVLLKRCIEWSQNQNFHSEKLALKNLGVYLEMAFSDGLFIDRSIHTIHEACPDNNHNNKKGCITPQKMKAQQLVNNCSLNSGTISKTQEACSNLLNGYQINNFGMVSNGYQSPNNLDSNYSPVSSSSCSPLECSDFEGQLDRPKVSIEHDVSDEAASYDAVANFLQTDTSLEPCFVPINSFNCNQHDFRSTKYGVLPVLEAEKVSD